MILKKVTKSDLLVKKQKHGKLIVQTLLFLENESFKTKIINKIGELKQSFNNIDLF